MATPAEFRKVALSLPETVEKSHFGNPDFRVNNKIFAGLSDMPQRGSFKLLPDFQRTLLASEPHAFEPAAGAWGRSGWTYVELQQVSVAKLREVLSHSWRLIAPAALVASFERGSASKPSKTTARPRTASKKLAPTRR
jgi:hypothetical protein